MPKKLIFEEVKKYFEEHDCELLEKEYINANTKMRYRCSCGNDKCKITLGNFESGKRCIKCSGCEKLTFEFVKQYFGDHDCELFETEYINNYTPMKYRCDCGNDEAKITFSNFRSGHRCARCYGNEKLTFEFVKQYFGDHDCELLETEYINNQTPMKYICDCGNDECKICFNNFQSGGRCKKCGLRKCSGENSNNWIKNREELKERNKFKIKCRTILTNALQKTAQKKVDRTYKMLGYTAEELRQHIYAHLNWEKVKDKVYHIDHYFPIKAFLDYSIRNIKLINCLENLQPLTKEDNLKKGSKYDAEEFEEWLIGKGYEIICE